MGVKYKVTIMWGNDSVKTWTGVTDLIWHGPKCVSFVENCGRTSTSTETRAVRVAAPVIITEERG